MDAPYTYNTLPHSRCIRLIKLFLAVGDEAADIHFDLVVASLDTVPSYEALSYTWGGQPFNRPVSANGKRLLVTENAQAAMRSFRRRRKRDGLDFLLLWIDAICINQASTSEKEVQVAMMFEIYRKARWVDIWLGENNETTVQLFRLIRTIQNLNRPIYYLASKTPFVKTSWYFTAISLFSIWLCLPKATRTKIYAGLREFSLNSYWKRVWTVQEVIASRSCRIYWGQSSTLTLNTLDDLIGILQLAGGRTIDDGKLEKALEMHMLVLDRRLKSFDSRLTRFDLLTALVDKQASLPQDKIFALRAIFPRTFGQIPVDYNRDITKIHIEAAISIIKTTRSLDILRYACHSGKRLGCPSWVPEWTSDDPSKGTLASKATNLCQPLITFPDDVSRIRLMGMVVGILSNEISDPFHVELSELEKSIEENKYVRILQDAMKSLHSWIINCSAQGSHGDYLTQLAVLLAQLSRQPQKQTRAWLSSLPGEGEAGDSGIEHQFGRYREKSPGRVLARFFAYLLAGRSICVTTDGRLACAFNGRPGDTIVLLCGANIPYLIRRSSPDPNGYKLVSSVVAYSMMQGELWPWNWELDILDSDRTLLQEFELE